MDFPPISEELAVWAAIDLANWGRRNNTAIDLSDDETMADDPARTRVVNLTLNTWSPQTSIFRHSQFTGAGPTRNPTPMPIMAPAMMEINHSFEAIYSRKVAFDMTGVPAFPSVEHNSSFRIHEDRMDSLILPLLDLGDMAKANETLRRLTTMYQSQETYTEYVFHNMAIDWAISRPHFSFFYDTMMQVDAVHSPLKQIWECMTAAGYPPHQSPTWSTRFGGTFTKVLIWNRHYGARLLYASARRLIMPHLEEPRQTLGEEELPPALAGIIPLLIGHVHCDLFTARQQARVYYSKGADEYLNRSVHIIALHYLAQDSKVYTHSHGTRWEIVCRNQKNMFEATVREVIASAATWIYLVYEMCARQSGTLPVWDVENPIAHLFDLRMEALHVYFRVLHAFSRAADQHAAHIAHFFEGIMVAIPRI